MQARPAARPAHARIHPREWRRARLRHGRDDCWYFAELRMERVFAELRSISVSVFLSSSQAVFVTSIGGVLSPVFASWRTVSASIGCSAFCRRLADLCVSAVLAFAGFADRNEIDGGAADWHPVPDSARGRASRDAGQDLHRAGSLHRRGDRLHCLAVMFAGWLCIFRWCRMPRTLVSSRRAICLARACWRSRSCWRRARGGGCCRTTAWSGEAVRRWQRMVQVERSGAEPELASVKHFFVKAGAVFKQWSVHHDSAL